MKHSQGHKYILSFDDNEQLMLALHEMCEVKQRARPYLHGHLVSETQTNKMVYYNILFFGEINRVCLHYKEN